MNPLPFRTAVVGALVGGLCAAPAFAAPASAAKAENQTNGTFTACVNKKSGAMRLLKKPKAKCKRSERKVSWSQTGPAGATGTSNQMAAWAAGTPTIDASQDWQTVLSVAVTGSPGKLYSWGADGPQNSEGRCLDGQYFSVERRIIVNGVENPLSGYWQAVSGTVTLQLQARAYSYNSGSGIRCSSATPFGLGVTNLYALVATAP